MFVSFGLWLFFFPLDFFPLDLKSIFCPKNQMYRSGDTKLLWWGCFRCFRAVGFCVSPYFGKMLERSDSQSFGCSLQHLHFLKEQMQFMTCLTFFLLSPMSAWDLYSLYVQGRAKAVKNYSLHFQFSEFVKAFYFPVCWALFSKEVCCEESLSRPCNLKIWGFLLHAECLLSTCHSSPTLADLGLSIWRPPCPPSLTLFHTTRGKVDFETRVYYAEQGLSLLNYCRWQHGKLQTHKSPVPPCGNLVTAIVGGVVKISGGECVEGGSGIKKQTNISSRKV